MDKIVVERRRKDGRNRYYCNGLEGYDWLGGIRFAVALPKVNKYHGKDRFATFIENMEVVKELVLVGAYVEPCIKKLSSILEVTLIDNDNLEIQDECKHKVTCKTVEDDGTQTLEVDLSEVVGDKCILVVEKVGPKIISTQCTYQEVENE